MIIIQSFVWQIIFSTLCGSLLALIFQGLNSWIAAVSLVTGGILAYLCRPILSRENGSEEWNWDWIDALVISFILLLGLRHFAYLYFSSDKAVQTLLKYNYGDLPLHLTYIRNMVDGTIFPPDNPFFSLEKLRYPFGMDLYNAFWEQLRIPTHTHLFLTGLMLLAATVLALYRFGGIIVVGAFFLNGGIAWQWSANGLDFQEPLTWKNFYITLFITQRGLLMAIPLALWLIRGAREQFYVPRDNAEPWSPGQTLLFGLAWGALPLFHMHAFIVVSLLIAFYLLAGIAPKANLYKIAPALSWAVPLATAFVLYLTDLFRKSSIIHVQWDWFSPGNLAYFFGVETGPWTIFILTLAVFRIWKGNGRERIEWLMAGGAFLLFNAVLLAPWDWDKLKVLLWFYLILAALSARAIIFYLTPLRKMALCFVLFFTATVCLLAVSGSNARPTRLYEWRELWNTKGAIVNLPKSSVIAATPTFNHPLSFWGQAIAVGYSGHLWSHGVDYKKSEKMINQLYTNGDNWAQIADQLHLTHIFWGPMERTRYGNHSLKWRTILPNISPVPGYELYVVVPRLSDD